MKTSKPIEIIVNEYEIIIESLHKRKLNYEANMMYNLLEALKESNHFQKVEDNLRENDEGKIYTNEIESNVFDNDSVDLSKFIDKLVKVKFRSGRCVYGFLRAYNLHQSESINPFPFEFLTNSYNKNGCWLNEDEKDDLDILKIEEYKHGN